MKKLKHLLVALFTITVFVTDYGPHTNNDPAYLGMSVNVVVLSTVPAEIELIGENNSGSVVFSLANVTPTLTGIQTAIANAVRAWATQHGFTVPANRVLTLPFQAN